MNAPATWTGVKWSSNTSTVPAWKLVAYSKVPAAALSMAIPLYTAPLAELSTAITTGVPRNPEIVPSSLAKMKRAGPVPAPLFTTKPVPPLKTTPVGALCWPIAPGTVTISGMVPPPTLYTVERPFPLSEIHHGDIGLETSPQALTRLVSTRSAGTDPSDTRLCCR